MIRGIRDGGVVGYLRFRYGELEFVCISRSFFFLSVELSDIRD